MYPVTRGSVFIVTAFLSIGIVSFPSRSNAALPCSNPHTATAEDIAAGYPRGAQVCPQDYETSGVTPDSGAAKEYLRSIFKSGGRCSHLTPEADKIGALNSTFAVCAAKFLKAVRQEDPSIYITSAYRTSAQQGCMCGSGSSGCLAAGRSNHQLGIALDLHARNYAWLHAQIRKFPGLRHLTLANDPYHMDAIRGGPCIMPGYRPPDFTPDSFASSPSSNISDGARDFLNSSQPEQKCTLPDGVVVPCTAIANRGSPPGGAAQGGQQGGAPPQALPSNQQPFQNMPQPTPVSNLITATSGISIPFPDLYTSSTSAKKKTPAIDLIDAIANPNARPAETETAPLVLTIDGSEAHTLTQEQVQQTTQVPYGPSYQLTPPGAQQTFVSNDLSQSLPQNTYAPQNRSALFAILETMKQTLLRALEYLRPFGRPHPPDGAYDEWAE